MNKSLEITTLSPTETIAQALGISHEREEELDALIDKYYQEAQEINTYPALIAKISKHCENINEIAYACFYIGAFAESKRAKQEILQEILQKIQTNEQ